MTMNDWINLAAANWDVVLTGGSAFIAMLGAVISHSETQRQKKLQLQQLRTQVDGASLNWGSDAIGLFAEAGALAHLCKTPVSTDVIESRKADLGARLSAMVDQGRLFFPNIDPEGKGAEKMGAFRGYRPPILDALMYAYYEVQALSRSDGPSPKDSANFIFDCRRLFVSELQAHLDPRRQDEVVDRYDRQRDKHRREALDIAGRLGVRLDVRRPGLLTEIGDKGWMDRIGPEERKTILQTIHQEAESE